ncbi:putative holin [Alloalcanivorax xenomutans]|uniref:putative holin n=1 Tax=Alloalcanivorax xenomutans TaxID=1094342 RepID=UPI00300BF1AC
MRFPRLTEWLVITIGLLVVIALIQPQQLPVVLYKASLVTMGAVLGYWIDRTLFPYARPHTFARGTQAVPCAAAMVRRALVVLACILGLTLGL